VLRFPLKSRPGIHASKKRIVVRRAKSSLLRLPAAPNVCRKRRGWSHRAKSTTPVGDNQTRRVLPGFLGYRGRPGPFSKTSATGGHFSFSLTPQTQTRRYGVPDTDLASASPMRCSRARASQSHRRRAGRTSRASPHRPFAKFCWLTLGRTFITVRGAQSPHPACPCARFRRVFTYPPTLYPPPVRSSSRKSRHQFPDLENPRGGPSPRRPKLSAGRVG